MTDDPVVVVVVTYDDCLDAGIQAGMGVVVLTTVALLAAILITVFSRSREAAD